MRVVETVPGNLSSQNSNMNHHVLTTMPTPSHGNSSNEPATLATLTTTEAPSMIFQILKCKTIVYNYI